MKDLFGLENAGTNVKREIVAGLTTFFTMAYISSSIRTCWPRPA